MGRSNTITVYRVQHSTGQGLWYDVDGTWNPTIMTLTEGISRDLPMGFDSKYNFGGKDWFCGCADKTSFQNWFSALDVAELTEMGFELLRLDVAEFIVEPVQVLFTKEGVVSQTQLNIGDLFSRPLKS